MTLNESAKTGWQEIVREWLRRNDRTQAWLCRQARLSETQFSKQMRRHREIDDYDLHALEAAMEIRRGTLVDTHKETCIDEYRRPVASVANERES